MAEDRVAIIGSGELAHRLIYYIEETGFGTVSGMFDDFEPPGSQKYGRPIWGKISEIPDYLKKGVFDHALIGIGYRHLEFRKQVFNELKNNNIPMATFIHPSAHVEKSAVIQNGCVILVNCTVDMNAHVGENVLLSSAGFISHDVTVGAHTYCGPAVNIAGHSNIGECCFLGIGTTTVDQAKIGSHAITAAGAVIIKNVPPKVLVAGVPAVIKKNLT